MNKILRLKNIFDVQKEMRKIGVSAIGINIMTNKFLYIVIKLKNIYFGYANILKQEMLSIGGEVAVSKGCFNGDNQTTDVLIGGTVKQYLQLIPKLRQQDEIELAGKIQILVNKNGQRN